MRTQPVESGAVFYFTGRKMEREKTHSHGPDHERPWSVPQTPSGNSKCSAQPARLGESRARCPDPPNRRPGPADLALVGCVPEASNLFELFAQGRRAPQSWHVNDDKTTSWWNRTGSTWRLYGDAYYNTTSAVFPFTIDADTGTRADNLDHGEGVIDDAVSSLKKL